MDVKYDQAQDLTLLLSKEEKAKLLREKTRDFHANSLRGISPELEDYVFLAYSYDEGHFFTDAENLGTFGNILVPDGSSPGDPWLINLSDEGVRFFRRGWPYGVRYNAVNKLFIRTGEKF